MKISVITPTIYKDRLDLVKQSLENQLFDDFEWLVGSPFEYKHAKWVKDDFKGGYWSLNRIYNKLFKEAKGELIVSLQDNIWVDPLGLKKFWEAYQRTGGIVSGVGDQYKSLDKYGKPIVKVWIDPRKHQKYGQNAFYECEWNDAEFNWCAIPREEIFKIGGMDEQLDFLGYGGDQLQLCERMAEAGVKSHIDQANESFTLRHGRVKDWDKNHVLFNGKYDKRKAELQKQGKWPYLDYL